MTRRSSRSSERAHCLAAVREPVSSLYVAHFLAFYGIIDLFDATNHPRDS